MQNISKFVFENNRMETAGGVQTGSMVFQGGDISNVGDLIIRNNSYSVGSFSSTAATSTPLRLLSIWYTSQSIENVRNQFLVEGNSVLQATSESAITYNFNTKNMNFASDHVRPVTPFIILKPGMWAWA